MQKLYIIDLIIPCPQTVFEQGFLHALFPQCIILSFFMRKRTEKDHLNLMTLDLLYPTHNIILFSHLYLF